MDDSRQGYRKFLEIQVEGFQEQLYALERDPEEVEALKAILRTSQRLRHAREEDEPEPVRLLRNAVEKVTLHLGHADLRVTQDFLDFYIDTFDLLEEGVRRWPDGPAFDRARYADRVRALLETAEPLRAPEYGRATAGQLPAAEAPAPSTLKSEPAPEPALEAWESSALAGSPATLDALDEASLPLGGAHPGARGGVREGAPALEPPLEEVPTWREAGVPPEVEVVRASDLTLEERGLYMEMSLRELLTEPWPAETARARRLEAAEVDGGEAGGEIGGEAGEGAGEGTGQVSALAASYSTFESLRSRDGEEGGDGSGYAAAATAEASPETQAALDRLRDVLDTLSLSLDDVDSAAERLLEEDLSALGRETLMALVERLEVDKERLLSSFDHSIEGFRESVV